MMPRGFAKCAGCGHASVVRLGAACGHCGSAMAEAEAPPELFGSWRCACEGCLRTPC